MKFARIVFIGAGIWGIVLLTPLYFLFDAVGRQYPAPINYPQGYFGFLAITMAWQLAFLAIGSDPARYRLLMLPSMIEKFGYVLTMALLWVQRRIAVSDLLVTLPDFVLGVLFVIAFMKVSAFASVRREVARADRDWLAS